MYGTLRGALAGRQIAFERESYKAAVEGRIVGVGKTIRITWDASLRAGDRVVSLRSQDA